jgi:hypothetical protein
MKKVFVNPETNKEWWIETEGLKIRTCLNNGKIKEIVCEEYQRNSKPAGAMIAQMSKGFIYQNAQAGFGEAICHHFVGRANNGFWPIATSAEKEDFFITRIVGDFEDETLYHFDRNGNVLETVSLGAKRMTYEQILCPDGSILMNNSELIERFSPETHEITPFAEEKDNFKPILDSKGDFVLWCAGAGIVVFDFQNNREVWREEANCNFYGQLSPRHTKVAYRTLDQGYILVDLNSLKKIAINNTDWHPFFSPDDACFSVGGKFYDSDSGDEISNPFPFTLKQGLADSDIFTVKICGDLIAIQKDRGDSPIEIWDYKSKEKLIEIDDVFVVRHASFEFAKDNLVIHTDYGAVSIYNCSK